MRIGILIDELAAGSAPKVIGQSVRGLEKLGHVCEAIVLIDNQRQKELKEVYNFHLSGIKIKYIMGNRPWWDLKLPGFSFFSLHHFFSFLEAPFRVCSNEYDLVISNAQTSSFAAWGMKLFRGIPYVFYAHCDPCTHTLKKHYSNSWQHFLYPLIYTCAHFLDSISMKGALFSITSGKLHQERFRKVTNRPLETLQLGCFALREFIPYQNRKKVILAFDRWDIGNKPNIFLETLQNLDNEISLKVGGFWHPASLKEKFINEIHQRKLEKRVEIIGPLHENNIIEECSKAMLHVHPNQEAFGMQTLEAAACGCCIIIPKGSGVADLFQEGVHGYFPETSDAQELTKYIKVVFSDLRKAEEMGRNAWQIASSYSWSNYAIKLESLIKKYTTNR